MSNISKKAETSALILSVAQKLFTRYGFEKTSMDEIARVAHKAKGSLYHYFPSKEDLIKTLLNQEFDRIKEQLRPLLIDHTITEKDRICRYILQRMDLINHSLPYHNAIRMDMTRQLSEFSPSFLADFLQGVSEWESEQLSAILNTGKEKQEFPATLNVPIFVNMLVVVLQSLSIPFFINGKYEDYTDTFKFFIEYITQKL